MRLGAVFNPTVPTPNTDQQPSKLELHFQHIHTTPSPRRFGNSLIYRDLERRSPTGYSAEWKMNASVQIPNRIGLSFIKLLERDRSEINKSVEIFMRPPSRGVHMSPQPSRIYTPSSNSIHTRIY